MKNSWKKKGHIGIVEKAQETSSDSDMHNTVLVPLLYFMNSGCVLECRETPTSWVTTYIRHPPPHNLFLGIGNCN